VDIVISTGPAPRVIPAGLIGQSLDAVRLALDGIQVGNNVTEAFSEEVVGTVTQMNVTDGQSVPRGTIVELTVSKGPEPLPIPNTVGMTVAAATAALDQKGLSSEWRHRLASQQCRLHTSWSRRTASQGNSGSAHHWVGRPEEIKGSVSNLATGWFGFGIGWEVERPCRLLGRSACVVFPSRRDSTDRPNKRQGTGG
jgi:hypothetical protein